MSSGVPRDLVWLEPWQPVDEHAEALAAELRKELGPKHVLFGRPMAAVGRRVDNDDVLFVSTGAPQTLAVVHLTWCAGQESDPGYPATTLFQSWEDWVERGLRPDHRDYTGA